jgi:HD-GYP domain-containing protein (c-di-GMP phosphodiesterase class II)
MRIGVTDRALESLYRGSLLHDIGKIGIPDAILLKPGQLEPGEWEVMRQHPEIGASILGRISFLGDAVEVPLAHHEAWDGSGYPRGLRKEEIPLSARIFAVIDTYDALRSARPYKAAMEHEAVVEIMKEAAGYRLDPELVRTFASEPKATWLRLGEAARSHGTFAGAMRACLSEPGR